MSMEGTPIHKQGLNAANDNDPLPFGKTVEALRNRLANDVGRLGRLIMLAELAHMRQKNEAVPNIDTHKSNEKWIENMHKKHEAAHAWLIDPAFPQKSEREIKNFIAKLRVFLNDALVYWDIPMETIDPDAVVIEFPKKESEF